MKQFTILTKIIANASPEKVFSDRKQIIEVPSNILNKNNDCQAIISNMSLLTTPAVHLVTLPFENEIISQTFGVNQAYDQISHFLAPYFINGNIPGDTQLNAFLINALLQGKTNINDVPLSFITELLPSMDPNILIKALTDGDIIISPQVMTDAITKNLLSPAVLAEILSSFRNTIDFQSIIGKIPLDVLTRSITDPSVLNALMSDPTHTNQIITDAILHSQINLGILFTEGGISAQDLIAAGIDVRNIDPAILAKLLQEGKLSMDLLLQELSNGNIHINLQHLANPIIEKIILGISATFGIISLASFTGPFLGPLIGSFIEKLYLTSKNFIFRLFGKPITTYYPKRINLSGAAARGGIAGGIIGAVKGGLFGSMFGVAGIITGIGVGLVTGALSGILGGTLGAALYNFFSWEKIN